jgi:uncharacterized protein YndB with AHSA1/START domain
VTTTERFMPVPPDAVWDTLADPAAYADWVVGSRAIRGADDGWPQAGTRLAHTLGIGPLTIRDETESLEARMPRRLRMIAHARPLGSAQVTMDITPQPGGALVRITERPAGALSLLELNPLFRLATRVRNGWSLERLEHLALERSR